MAKGYMLATIRYGRSLLRVCGRKETEDNKNKLTVIYRRGLHVAGSTQGFADGNGKAAK